MEHSPNLDIVEISSEDDDVPISLFEAIDKAFLEEASVQDRGKIDDINVGLRKIPISSAEAESIIHYFGGEMEKDRLNYEFYVSYVDYTFSILIQYSLHDIKD